MKFGEQLQRDAINEWQSMYIDYDTLKSLLKKIPYLSYSKNLADESLAFAPLSLDEALFLNLLEHELLKVNTFYSSKETEFRNSKQAIDQVFTTSLSQLTKKRSDQLRRAYLELYRGLLLLGSYRRLNKIGFRKIVKKFDKITGRNYAATFNQSLNTWHIFSNQVILSSLVSELEDFYTAKFASGDRHAAMQALRLPSDLHYLGGKLHHRSSFMSGLYIGASLIFLIVFYLIFRNDPIFLYIHVIIFGLPLALLWGFVLVELICSFTHISHGFIFEFDPRDTLQISQRAELLALSTLILIGLVSFFSQLQLAPEVIITTLFILVLMVIPFPFYFSARLYFFSLCWNSIYSLFRGPIKFKNFLFGDSLLSLGFWFRSPVFIFVILFNRVASVQELWMISSTYIFPLIGLLSIPPLLRIFQSLRRFMDDKTHSTTHLLNVLKYFFILLATTFSLFRYSTEALPLFLSIIWILVSVVSSLFSLYWDMVMDWGFSLQSKNSILLRNSNLVVGGGNRFPYYLVIILNGILRFTWGIPNANNPWVTLLFAYLEVFRRAIWMLFRLEHEHLNNCGQFKVLHVSEEFGVAIQHYPQINEADLFPVAGHENNGVESTEITAHEAATPENAETISL